MTSLQKNVYICTLSAEVREIAKRELREDDKTREEALQNFRNWIQKQPFIRKCRTDDRFLLRFLRAKKFSLPLAQESLLNYLSTQQTFPQWFLGLDPVTPLNLEMANNGHMFRLLERDDHKRAVVFNIARAAKIQYTVEDVFKSFAISAEIAFECEEEDQVRGFVFITDYKDVALPYVAVYTPTIQSRFIKSVVKLAQVRLKQIHIVNIHPTIASIVQFALKYYSEKLQKRVVIHNDMDTLYKYIPRKIFPKEYGGEVPLRVMTDAWKQRLMDSKEYIARVNQVDVDKIWSQTRHGNANNVMGCEGSFRKLDID